MYRRIISATFSFPPITQYNYSLLVFLGLWSKSGWPTKFLPSFSFRCFCGLFVHLQCHSSRASSFCTHSVLGCAISHSPTLNIIDIDCKSNKI